MEDVRGILLEPLPRLVEDHRLDTAHQHDVQHRVVGDEDVRWVILHVPARPHLAAVHGGEEPRSRFPFHKLRVSMCIGEVGPQPTGCR
jgi:hypothetical protein